MKQIIKAIQIDVNGLCNAGCWYCPVAYLGNPKFAQNDMTLDMLDEILKQLSAGMGDFVDPNLSIVYTAHYNEILLYKDFEGMLDIYRKHGFKINVLSNGVALTNNKSDIIYKNIDVINEVLLNIPAGDEDTWSKYVNLNKSIFKRVISNVNYAKEKFGNKINIMVNGLNDKSMLSNGGWIDILPLAPDLDLDVSKGSMAEEVSKIRALFPELTVFSNHHLYDRAGHLEELNIIGQSNAIKKYLNKEGQKVIGCSGGIEVRDRTKEWIHINSNGEVFMCCDDFSFETIYGNINDHTLLELWHSQERKNMISQAQRTICTKCSAAVWG